MAEASEGIQRTCEPFKRPSAGDISRDIRSATETNSGEQCHMARRGSGIVPLGGAKPRPIVGNERRHGRDLSEDVPPDLERVTRTRFEDNDRRSGTAVLQSDSVNADRAAIDVDHPRSGKGAIVL